VTVVVEVEKLVLPLCYYSEGILQEGDHDEEAANGGEIATRQAAG